MKKGDEVVNQVEPKIDKTHMNTGLVTESVVKPFLYFLYKYSFFPLGRVDKSASPLPFTTLGVEHV